MKSTVIALTLLASTSMAYSAPIEFDKSPTSPARQVINVVFADYLRQRIGAEVETAAIDLDNDGTGEIIARFVHTASCNADLSSCRTVIIRYDFKNWIIAFDKNATKLDFSQHAGRVPGPIVVDGTTWNWGSRRYEPNGTSLGKEVKFEPVPSEQAGAYSAAFGEGTKNLSVLPGVQINYSTAKIADVETLIVSLSGNVVCGDSIGCPVRVLQKKDETWSTILSTTTHGKFSIAETSRGGYNDLVTETELGFVILGWNGNGYSIADRIEAVKGK